MKVQPVILNSRVIENKEIVPGYFLMRLDVPQNMRGIVPGCFFHIYTADRMDIILRRPFSVFDADKGSISILYELKGKGTCIMSRKRPGEYINIMGPLGRGFSIMDGTKQAVLVAGGAGIAPLFFWGKELLKKGIKTDVFLGAKNRYRILCAEDLEGMGMTLYTAAEDGSIGFKGYVTDLFREKTDAYNKLETEVYACGPEDMLIELSRILGKCGIRGYVSVERRMGCGVGVCLGCVIKVRGGMYKRVCRDGPVFGAEEVEW